MSDCGFVNLAVQPNRRPFVVLGVCVRHADDRFYRLSLPDTPANLILRVTGNYEGGTILIGCTNLNLADVGLDLLGRPRAGALMTSSSCLWHVFTKLRLGEG